MLKSYFKTAIRNLARNKVVSFINIAGLSIGLACFLLIILYTKDELTFDRFQQNKDRLFRITCEISDKPRGRYDILGESAAVQGPAFKAEIPEVDEFVRVYEQNFIVRNGATSYPQQATWVDANFFQVFSFPLISGDPQKILTDPHAVVLTEDMAKKYFGTMDAIGQVLELEIDNQFIPFQVSGIAKRSPENSSIQFEILLPFSWYAQHSDNDHGYWHLLNYSTFLLMAENSDLEQVREKMNAVYKKNAQEQLDGLSKSGATVSFVWGLQPFLAMHLDTRVENEGSIKNESKPIYSFVLNGIAFFILLIACINFINLSIAQSLKRAREIGLRKVVGSSRHQLVKQFLGESVLLCSAAFALAILLAWSVLPLFNSLANKQLSLSYLLDVPLVASFVGLFLLTSLAVGSYPALVLSGFRPVETLTNRIHIKEKHYLSKTLMVVQFALASFLIIVTSFIYFQYDFLTHANLGYDEENLLVINTRGQGRNFQLLNEFKSRLSQVQGVLRVGSKLNGRYGTSATADGRPIDIDYDHIDEDYLPTLGVPIVLGRNFSADFPSDSVNSALINEAFVKEMGWNEPIGQTIDFDHRLIVVGVVKDYHFASMKEKIYPKLFTMDPKMSLGRFLVRLNPGDLDKKIMRAIETIHKDLLPDHPMDSYFVKSKNQASYDAENKWRQIITYASIITIFISCIGLLGLTLLAVRKRTREIGVRKVLGASAWQVIMLLVKNLIGLILLAFFLAAPVAAFVTERWLENFPYRIPMHSWVFVLTAVLILLVALLTVSVQAIRAANSNPVTSLRSE